MPKIVRGKLFKKSYEGFKGHKSLDRHNSKPEVDIHTVPTTIVNIHRDVTNL